MTRERARSPWWAIPVLVVFFAGISGRTAEAGVSERDVDKRNPTQAGEFLDSTALAILVGGSSRPSLAESAVQNEPLRLPERSASETDPLSGLLDGAYPGGDEEPLRWKDAEETPVTEIDPADGEIDPFSDGLSMPESPAPPNDSPAD